MMIPSISFKSVTFLSLTFILLTFGCSPSQEDKVTTTEDVSDFIRSYTRGDVFSESEIIVQLSRPIDEEKREALSSLFTFRPSVQGTQHWADERTIVFTPESPLENGRNYDVRFALKDVYPNETPPDVFRFPVRVIPQDMEVSFSSLEPSATTPEHFVLRGEIITADRAHLSEVSHTLSAYHDREKMELLWDRSASNRFAFVIDGIERKEVPTRLEINWNGRPIGTDSRGSEAIMVSAETDFELIDVHVATGANPHVVLSFSELLDESQNLRGLIQISGQANPGLIIENNRIIVHPASTDANERTLQISGSIRSRDGRPLDEAITRRVVLGSQKPEVRLIGSGNVMPASKELLLPFMAVNLGAIDVQVIRIFENNIPYFLQRTSLSGSRNLHQVGRPVAQEVISLQTLGQVDAGKWGSFALDMSDIIEPEPGAIYQVTIGFRQHQSLYPCDDDHEEAVEAAAQMGWVQDNHIEQDFWNRFRSIRAQGEYNWRDRDDPCTPSYYHSGRRVQRNLLASDFGLIAKQDALGGLKVFVTDLNTAKPIEGVDVEVLDYQIQSLNNGRTDRDGSWTLSPSDELPFLLVASRGDEKGYLRLNDGQSLSLSDFDVAGQQIMDGVKAFIYAERNVWRPGDSLFVNMIVESDGGILPRNHPATFELVDPTGRVAERHIAHPFNGFYSFPTRTPSDATTGQWLVRVYLGGNIFTKNVNIETIQPNRLRINLDFDEHELTGTRTTLKASIQAEWLHGAVASELNTDVQMTMRQGGLSFSNHPLFTFTDPTRTLESGRQEIFSGTLDADGHVSFSRAVERPNRSPGLVMLGLQTRVFEESGNFSTNRSQVRYIPFDRLAGFRIAGRERDSKVLQRRNDYKVEALLVDAEGNPIANEEVSIQLYRLDWRWWWQRREENISQYFARTNRTPVISESLKTDTDGKAVLDFPMDDLRWGRYLIIVADGSEDNGHSAGEIVFVGWGRDSNVQIGDPQRLIVETDETSYETGDDIELSFPGSKDGRALISLENGTHIIDAFWVNTRAGQNSVKIRATPEMSPNVYASIHLIQPHGQTDNDLPIRMFGVVPIEVENPDTRLTPVIQMPDELRPESQSTLTIREENGKEMTYTIAIVDEGLLDITNFRTPNPRALFYAREALGILSWDIYNDVVGTYAESLRRILAIGGDMEAEDDGEKDDVNRFPPMVRHMGPFYLAAGQTATHDIDVPNYIGSVRTMIVAGHEKAYGRAEERTPVRQPVMVLATLPRVLSPGETVTLPASIFAMRDDIRNVDVSVEASDIFEITGPSTKEAVFDRMGDQTLRFSLKVKEETGTGRIRIDARSGSESGYDEITIEIRNPSPPATRTHLAELQAGESWDIEYEPFGLTGTNTATLEIAGFLPIDLTRRLRFLMRYPHGCLEQRTSAVFPQLFLHHFIELSDDDQRQIKRNIEAYINQIERYNHPSYGLSYWPGHDGTNSWSTIYAWHFLLEARDAGYYVPSSLMQHLRQVQQRLASDWREANQRDKRRHVDLVQSYRLYVLARAGEPSMGAMNRLREHRDLSLQARWRLAAAYQIAGIPEAADDLARGVSTTPAEYRELGYTFGSRLRDQAMILEALSHLGHTTRAATVMRDISEKLNSDDWLSTQETAYALLASAVYLEKASPSTDMSVTFDGTSIGTGSVQGEQPLSIHDYTIPGNELQSLLIDNQSEGTVFIRLVQEGVPLTDNLEAESMDLNQQVHYYNPDGGFIDPTTLRQGTDIIAEVTVTNPGNRGDYTEMALTHMVPSGWEITNVRLDDIAYGETTSSGTHQDIRDDRIMTYFDLRAGESKTFEVRLTATYEGRFFMPAITTYAMYDNSIYARTPGKWIDVVRE